MSALPITAAEYTRAQQARTEVRNVMTEGTSGGGVIAPILTVPQYDTVGSPTADFNEAIALATIRAISKLPVLLPPYVKTGLPSAAANLASMIYVVDEAGGAVPAFSDGTNWRRVTDRAVVS